MFSAPLKNFGWKRVGQLMFVGIAVLVYCRGPANVLADEAPAGPPIPITRLNRSSPVDFEQEVLPILRSNCLACHNRTRSKADLVLETPADIRKGGENGEAVVPGHSAQSLLLQAASHQAKPLMPPKDNKVFAAELTGEQLGLIALWIDQGATGEVRAAGPIRWQAPAGSLQPIYAVAVTADGQYVAAGRANQIHLYHLPTQRLIGSLADPQLAASGLYGTQGAAHRDMVQSLAFSPDGTLLSSGGFGEVKLWRRSAPAPKSSLAMPLVGTSSSGSPRLVACGADGKWIAVASEATPIQLFDAATGKWSKALAASTSSTRAMEFSPDGTKLAVASADRGLRVSMVQDGGLLAQMAAPVEINAIAWVSSGRQIAGAGADGIIRVWQVPESAGAAWGAVKELKGHSGPVTCLAAMPGGGQLISGGADGSIRQWDVSDGRMVRQLAQGAPVNALAVRSDGKFFASAGQNGARLWDAGKGTIVADLKGSALMAREVAERDRAQKLAIEDVAYFKSVMQKAEAAQQGTQQRVKKAADAKSNAEKLVAEKETARTKAAEEKLGADKALAAGVADLEQKQVAVAAADHLARESAESLAKAKADPAVTAEQRKMLEDDAAAKAKAATDAKAAVTKLAGDQRLKQAAEEKAKGLAKAEADIKPAALARSNAQTELRLATMAAGKAADELLAAKSAVATAQETQRRADASLAATRQTAASLDKPTRALVFSADQLTLATAGDDQMIHLWTSDGGVLMESIRGPQAAITGLAFTPGGTLLSSDTHGQATLWTLGGSWSLERTIGSGDLLSALTDRVNVLAFSPDGRLLATGSGEPSRSGQVKLWEVATGHLVGDFKDAHSDAVLALEFSPDGKLLASGAADRFAKVFDVAGGKLIKSFEGHTDHVLGVSWKADGRTLLTCGADKQIKIWEVISGQRLASAGGFGKAVTAIHFLGISDQAIAMAGDGQVRTINLTGGTVRSIAGTGDFLHAAAVTPDGQLIVAGSQKGILSIWRDPAAAPSGSFEPPGAASSVAR